MSQADVIMGAWAANLLLQIALVIRLFATGLWRPYRRFTAYMVGLTVESVALYPLTHAPDQYARVWVCTRSVLLVFQVLTVFEIFSRWSESHRNIGKFGQRLFVFLFGLATVLSVATVPVAWSAKGWAITVYLVVVTSRAAQFGAGAFMILMLLFFAKFGGPVVPNLRRHAVSMTVFSLANTLSYFLFSSDVAKFYANLSLQAITAGALIFWIVGFTRSGEQVTLTNYDPRLGAEAEETNRQMLEFAETVRQQRERESR